MPSLHTTWGLFLILSAVVRPSLSNLGAIAAALFAFYGVLTICGALTFGDHYLIDCVVAIPFATALLLAFSHAAGGRSRAVAACMWIGVALFCGWVAILRAGGDLLAWPMVYAMTAASVAHMAASAIVLRAAATPSTPVGRWT